jgi:hypothetical protein
MILRIVLMLRRGFWQGNSRETGLPRCGLRTDLTPISAGLAGASDYACYLHRHLGERGHKALPCASASISTSASARVSASAGASASASARVSDGAGVG